MTPQVISDREKVDIIIDQIDDLLMSGRFEDCDIIFQNLDPKIMSNLLIVTYLGITLGAKEKLSQRDGFYQRALEVVSQRRVDGQKFLRRFQ